MGQENPKGQVHNIYDESHRLQRYFVLSLLIISLGLFLYLIKAFLIEIAVAAVFTAIFYPVYQWFLKFFKGKKSIASAVLTVLLLLGLLIPIAFTLNIAARQAFELYQNAQSKAELFGHDRAQQYMDKLQNNELLKLFKIDTTNLQTVFQDGLKLIGNFMFEMINKTSKATVNLVVNLFIIFFTMFYFFRDGDRILGKINELLPLHPEHKLKIAARFLSISRATIRGTLVVAFIQGSFGALTLLIFGISGWLLWGMVMIFASIIPFLGPWTVLVPAGIIKIISGDTLSGIAIILISFLVVSTIDNVIRPWLVGWNAKVHDLMIFFSTIGGLLIFGVMGFIIGPLIAAIFLTVVDIYNIEFRKNIER